MKYFTKSAMATLLICLCLSSSCKASILIWDFELEVTHIRPDSPVDTEIGDIYQGILKYSSGPSAVTYSTDPLAIQTARFDILYLLIDIPDLTSNEWLNYDHFSHHIIWDHETGLADMENQLSLYYFNSTQTVNELIDISYRFDSNGKVNTDFVNPLTDWHMVPPSSINIEYSRHIADILPIDMGGVARSFTMRSVTEPRSLMIIIVLLIAITVCRVKFNRYRVIYN
jgi:hypothetical protein